MTCAGLDAVADCERFAHGCNATLVLCVKTMSILKPVSADGRNVDVLLAVPGAALSALPSFTLRKCCAVDEWQQCDRRTAALGGDVDGSCGPILLKNTC